MGFGRIGRQLYQLACSSEDFDIVAISDVGRPDVLHHLLTKTLGRRHKVSLEGNYLVSELGRTRMISAEHPTEIPWDLFDVDFVIDASNQFRSIEQLQPHIDNGARRVILSVLPASDIDRVILCGVNDADAQSTDRIVSAGSASTTATALTIATVQKHYAIEHASMTSVHAYTSDQRLQDYASADYRRSRSGAENIIPNFTPALEWVPRVMPEIAGKFSAYALNVPVQAGSMLDMTFSLKAEHVKADDINQLFIDAEAAQPRLIETVDDPVVSSDVKGSTKSLVVDLQGTLVAGKRTVKLLAWHETLGHAERILDVASHYTQIDRAGR